MVFGFWELKKGVDHEFLWPNRAALTPVARKALVEYPPGIEAGCYGFLSRDAGLLGPMQTLVDMAQSPARSGLSLATLKVHCTYVLVQQV